jgi:hypothetical protein
MAHSYVMLVLHIVFSTKGRVPFIGAEHRDRLYAYRGGIIRNERGLLLEVGRIPDHLHKRTCQPSRRDKGGQPRISILGIG